MTSTADFVDLLTTSITAVETGLESHTDTFGEPTVGPVTFDQIDFPELHIVPDTSDYQGGNVYQHRVFVNYYFERDTSEDYLDKLTEAALTFDSVMSALSADPLVGQYKPTSVDHYSGELGSTSLILVSVAWDITIQFDWADAP